MKFFSHRFLICLILISLVVYLSPDWVPCASAQSEDSELDRFKDRDKDEDEDKDREEDNHGARSWFQEMMLRMGFRLAVHSVHYLSQPDSTHFAPYPYAQGMPGFAGSTWSGMRSGFGQAQLVYHYIDHDLAGRGVRASGRLGSRIGIGVEGLEYQESLKEGGIETLSMFRLYLAKSLIIHEWIVTDINVGLKTIDEYAGLEVGGNLLWFVERPFVVRSALSLSMIDSDAFVDAYVGTGILLNRFEVNAGYRRLLWGGQDLSGFQIGAAFWF